MVSVKNNGANGTAIQTNKDGNIRKKSGRKPKQSIQQQNKPSDNILNGRYWKDERARLEEREYEPAQNGDEKLVIDGDQRVVLINDVPNVIESNLQRQSAQRMIRPSNVISATSLSQEASNQILINEVYSLRAQIEKQQADKLKSNTCNYRMKLDKFNGSKDDDYDVWWADMQAFFNLYNFSEQEKVNLFNAHLGGEARKFIQDEDVSNMDTVEKMDALLKSTFSSKQDWHSILMNIKQKPDEEIRAFSVRLRVAARKCGFKGTSLDTMSVTCLKRGCAPHLSNLLDNCLPHTPYDEIVEHAIQYERKQENSRKPSKRKIEEIDLIEDSENTSLQSKLKIAKIDMVKQDFTNSLKQIKDHVGSKYEKLSDELDYKYDQIQRTINNISSQNRDQRKVIDNRYRPYDNKVKDSNIKTSGYINACLHCAQPNHRFNDCRRASESQKNEIKRLLREKKYDFKELMARSNKLIQDRESRNKAPTTFTSRHESSQ